MLPKPFVIIAAAAAVAVFSLSFFSVVIWVRGVHWFWRRHRPAVKTSLCTQVSGMQETTAMEQPHGFLVFTWSCTAIIASIDATKNIVSFLVLCCCLHARACASYSQDGSVDACWARETREGEKGICRGGQEAVWCTETWLQESMFCRVMVHSLRLYMYIELRVIPSPYKVELWFLRHSRFQKRGCSCYAACGDVECKVVLL